MDNTANLDDDAIRNAMGGAEEVKSKQGLRAAQWPEPLDQAAFYGVAGEMVSLVAPHTESDPAALLIQLLVGAGNLFDRHRFFKVESTEHHLNLFAVLVGPSAKGRKGDRLGMGQARAHQSRSFLGETASTGLSSGEGLIYSVRDAVTSSGKGRSKMKHDNGPAITDEGVTDKRALFMQPEFSQC